MSGSQQLLLAAIQQALPDPNFEYTTLLLPGNGTNGAQNNTFLDSSTNNFTITRNGNTTQGSYSPFSQTGWSNYFDGSGDYLSVADNAALDLGTGDFTIECWVYPLTGISNVDGLIGKRNQGTFSGGDWRIAYVSASTSFGIACGSDNTDRTTPAINLNAWNHVAFVRSSGTLSCYANGLRNANLAWAHNLDNAEALLIGLNVATYDLPGYISNVRIVKGTAVYSGATYTVPTTPLTAITNTSLLTCQSNRFVDNSSNAFAITRNGDVSVQAFSPFNPTAAWSAATYGGSGYFDGSGDFLTVPDNSALEFGNSTLTLELWINTTATAQYTTLASRETTGFSSGMWALQVNGSGANSGDITFFAADFSVSTPLLQSTGSKVNDSAWHHVAVVRNVNSWTLYIDGVSRSTATWSGTVADIAGAFYIGASQAFGRNYSGYMTDLRLVKGTAVYTAAFTPPTAPLTAITNTSLLTNFTNAGIYDATSKNDLETVGNAQISTTQSKFGGSSMYFDGTGDYLFGPVSQNFALGAGDFTIECWVFPGSQTKRFPSIVSLSTPGIYLQYNHEDAPGKFSFVFSGVRLSPSATQAVNQWYHVAAVRYGSNAYLYINGISVATSAISASFSATNIGIGGSDFVSAELAFVGYIDDLRITKGIARYTSNFTPPTTAFLTL